MINPKTRTQFEQTARIGLEPNAVASLAQRLKRAGAEASARDRWSLAAVFLHAAFARPESIVPIYGAAARGWLGGFAIGPQPSLAPEPLPIEPALFAALDTLLEDMGAGRVGADITPRTASLAANVVPGFRERTAAAALTFPGVREAAAGGLPPKFTLASLAKQPPGSLGDVFHRLIVDNGFDLEVMDRDALGLNDLPTPLGYLNARILQCHDLWHIVAGYRTTGLHEIAISAFQLAQFGHTYSAIFLAVIAAGGAMREPASYPIIMETIFTAWRHGRMTPPLIGMDWEGVWDQPVEAARARLRVTPYASPYPADLFEQIRDAA
jgi:ubiquinone biosynthesis protein Coq4